MSKEEFYKICSDINSDLYFLIQQFQDKKFKPDSYYEDLKKLELAYITTANKIDSMLQLSLLTKALINNDMTIAFNLLKDLNITEENSELMSLIMFDITKICYIKQAPLSFSKTPQISLDPSIISKEKFNGIIRNNQNREKVEKYISTISNKSYTNIFEVAAQIGIDLMPYSYDDVYIIKLYKTLTKLEPNPTYERFFELITGLTPLMLAVLQVKKIGFKSLTKPNPIKLLIDNGADYKQIHTATGKTALDMALSLEIKTYLKELIDAKEKAESTKNSLQLIYEAILNQRGYFAKMPIEIFCKIVLEVIKDLETSAQEFVIAHLNKENERIKNYVNNNSDKSLFIR